MKHLRYAQNNAMNYVFLEDMDTETATLVDWDLSNAELRELVDTYYENGKDLPADRILGETYSLEEAYDGVWGVEMLEYYLDYYGKEK